ncbi:hypothetical protein C0991_012465 [Blastosporella zonata]|nr:hypothetical protein C0991_012465 [Blastosporella zonata]
MSQPSLSPSTLITGSKRKREPSGSPKLPNRINSNPRKRPNLTLAITIPTLAEVKALANDDTDAETTSPISGLSDPDSLFDEKSPLTSSDTVDSFSDPQPSPAILVAPPIRGLFFAPALRLPEEFAESVTQYCLETYFQREGVNQVMLFGRFSTPHSPSSELNGLPPILHHLLSKLETILRPVVPPETHDLLFPSVPSRSRQAILNLYQPGEGITPHVDLLRRFGDGIIGVSFGSGCVMQFARAGEHAGGTPESADIGRKAVKHEKNSWDVYLPERSVIVLSEDARYEWTHGIGKHTKDYVALSDATNDTPGQWIERGVRLSITFRWLLPGADVVGCINHSRTIAAVGTVYQSAPPPVILCAKSFRC